MSGSGCDLGGCRTHPFEHAASTCRTCASPYCKDCLVYSFGAGKPPFCVSCALVAAGIRRTPRVLDLA
ncbi:MAG: hypothetical protein NVSMB12_22290 [Acidimicrobiales bacterium]